MNSAPHAPESVGQRHDARARLAVWVVVVVFGAIHAFDARHALNPDAFNYLDMAEQLLAGEFLAVINGLWSPLYAAACAVTLGLLQPSLYWQFGAIHLLNLALMLIGLVAFEYFWSGLRRAAWKGDNGPPAWAWRLAGSALYLYSALHIITLDLIAPDLCVLAMVLWAAGIYVRIKDGRDGWAPHLALGAVLAVGYLSKHYVYLAGGMMLFCALFLRGDPRPRLGRVFAAGLVFLAVAAPYWVPLSLQKGRPALSDSATLNYAWHINRLPQFLWEGGPQGLGTPNNPPRRVLDNPPTYTYADAVEGTYPIWRDPVYWMDGATPRFSLYGHYHKFAHGMQLLHTMLLVGLSSYVVGILVLALVSDGPGGCARRLIGLWWLLLPALVVMPPMLMIHIEERYTAPFLLMFVGALLVGLIGVDRQGARRTITAVLTAMALALTLQMAGGAIFRAFTVARDVASGRIASGADHPHWRVAQALHEAGLRPGDRVGVIGNGYRANWARAGGYRLVLEVPAEVERRFWLGGPAAHEGVHAAAREIGARALVAPDPLGMPELPPEWEMIGDTGFAVYYPSTGLP